VTDGFEEGLHCWGGGKGGAREMEKEGRGEKEHNTGVRPSIIWMSGASYPICVLHSITQGLPSPSPRMAPGQCPSSPLQVVHCRFLQVPFFETNTTCDIQLLLK
jgi:hypothetical protein